MVTIRLKGMKEFSAALQGMSDEIKDSAKRAVTITAIEIQGDIKKSISKEGTGTLYFRIFNPETGYTNIFAGDSEGYVTSIKGKLNLSATHRASADGAPPATDTGRLVNSITFDAIREFTASVSSKLDYARWLEYGTIKMAPRPFFRPAKKRAEPKFKKRMADAILGATQ